jgi:ferredoxin
MRIRVNPVECTAHGLCAELLPEWVQLDEWGYPAIDPQELPEQLVRDARRAASACPALALKLTS